MMYPFLTLDDNTEIVHSEMRPDGTVKVYLERPDAELGFRHATCYLPSYTWEDVEEYCRIIQDEGGFSDPEKIREASHDDLKRYLEELKRRK